MPYAAQTHVLISRTNTDVEELLAKHGANGFACATEGDRSLVAFSMSGRRVHNNDGPERRCARQEPKSNPARYLEVHLGYFGPKTPNKSLRIAG